MNVIMLTTVMVFLTSQVWIKTVKIVKYQLSWGVCVSGLFVQTSEGFLGLWFSYRVEL